MRTNNLFRKVTAIVAIALTGVSISCQESEVALSQEASYVVEESVTDVYFEDADDLANVTMASKTETSGSARVASVFGIDDRLCAGVVVTLTLDGASTLDHPKGTIVLDFGDGCTDPRGNTRTGKIHIAFDGRRFTSGSTVVVTFENYSINEIKLEGTRTLTNVTGSSEDVPKFQIELVGGKATWPDGTDATREHCFVRSWNRGNKEILSDDVLTVTQCADAEVAASGTNRKGVEYTMTIEQPLVYNRSCAYRIPVSGIKKFVEVSTGKEVVIDYGNGECDRIITITVNGNSRTIEAKGK